MTAFLPRRGPGVELEPDHPRLQQPPPSPAEQRARWEVRAALWRARELAETVFGPVAGMGVSGIRAEGPLRGMMRLHVPFDDLDAHRAREASFMAAVEADPLLARVRLVYVFGPATG
ncbi:MAG: hypothetical protein R3304_06130 [Longimicrobiales bacterium]|nr:hypothetical protein [Longimicrobiales bacterium]